jgi:hypothetical protein
VGYTQERTQREGEVYRRRLNMSSNRHKNQGKRRLELMVIRRHGAENKRRAEALVEKTLSIVLVILRPGWLGQFLKAAKKEVFGNVSTNHLQRISTAIS